MTGVADPAGVDVGRRVRVEEDADLRDDPALDRADAAALATALPTDRAEIAFRLPLVLAEQTVLEPTAGSDRIFVAETRPDRPADGAFYARQGRRGCWVPRAEATVYELAPGGDAGPPAGRGSRLGMTVEYRFECPRCDRRIRAADCGLRGRLAAEDDVPVCADCGYYFGRHGPGRQKSNEADSIGEGDSVGGGDSVGEADSDGEAGPVSGDHGEHCDEERDAVAAAIDDFLR